MPAGPQTPGRFKTMITGYQDAGVCQVWPELILNVVITKEFPTGDTTLMFCFA